MRTVGIKPDMLEAVAIELDTDGVKRIHQGQNDIYPKVRCERARRKTQNLSQISSAQSVEDTFFNTPIKT